MTLDDIMALAASCYSRIDPEPQWKLRAAIEQSIAAERERCAKVCDAWTKENHVYVNGAIRCAEDIRRGTI